MVMRLCPSGQSNLELREAAMSAGQPGMATQQEILSQLFLTQQSWGSSSGPRFPDSHVVVEDLTLQRTMSS